jgi:hypothetical protein
LTYPGRVTPFDRQTVYEHAGFGPFLMFTRRLFEAAGPFDEWFRVWGDVDWLIRALRHADFCLAAAQGGTFRLHGRNLGWPDDLEARQVRHAELNVIALEHGWWDKVRATDPAVMRATWAARQSRVRLPEWLEARLWGAEAEARWDATLRARRAPLPWARRLARGVRWRGYVLARAALRRASPLRP